ncbi:hypothetical protein [Leifsonia sp. NCR5]|uniref:DUF7169 domain-containing protein n=1 Tax=Leifsonia sp. NCR5 TaxID=1978342 RepID=UPI000A199DA2|nr:hypothetical protein [Leifsonia sp. NCR5]
MTATTTSNVLEAFGAAYLRLWALQHGEDVQQSQWQTGNTPQPREDTTERSKGLTSDPTPHIVMDERRLRLRAASIEAEQTLVKAERALNVTARRLEKALESFESGAPESSPLGK